MVPLDTAQGFAQQCPVLPPQRSKGRDRPIVRRALWDGVLHSSEWTFRTIRGEDVLPPIPGNAKKAVLHHRIGRTYHHVVALGDHVLHRPRLRDLIERAEDRTTAVWPN